MPKAGFATRSARRAFPAPTGTSGVATSDDTVDQVALQTRDSSLIRNDTSANDRASSPGLVEDDYVVDYERVAVRRYP